MQPRPHGEGLLVTLKEQIDPMEGARQAITVVVRYTAVRHGLRVLGLVRATGIFVPQMLIALKSLSRDIRVNEKRT